MNSYKISFIGDLFPANMPYNIGFGIASQFNKHLGNYWKPVIESHFKDSEIVIANLEAPLLPGHFEPQNNSFAGDIRFAKFIKEAGINLISIANNHILEHGENGFNSTLQSLQEQDLKVVGINDKDTSNVCIIEKEETRIGFAAFSSVPDGKSDTKYARFSEESVMHCVRMMHEMKIDLKVLILHWGTEYVRIPSYKQINTAHRLIDQGVNLIIGHHPHVIQPVEKYNGGLIFYSLGNFLFDMAHSQEVKTGMIADIFLSNNIMVDYHITPIFINDDYCPIPHPKFEKILAKVKSSEKKMISMFEKSPPSYGKLFTRLATYSRLYNRILMKLNLIFNLYRISPQTRKIIKSKFKKRISILTHNHK